MSNEDYSDLIGFLYLQYFGIQLFFWIPIFYVQNRYRSGFNHRYFYFSSVWTSNHVTVSKSNLMSQHYSLSLSYFASFRIFRDVYVQLMQRLRYTFSCKPLPPLTTSIIYQTALYPCSAVSSNCDIEHLDTRHSCVVISGVILEYLCKKRR